MSKFTGSLTITEIDIDSFCWRLSQPLVYEVGELESGRIISVPVGYITDGATIPRALWWWMPSWGRYSRAAVLHDYLCTCLVQGHPHKEAPRRKDADAIFYEALAVCNVSWTVRSLLWLGVRFGEVLSTKFKFRARNEQYNKWEELG